MLDSWRWTDPGRRKRIHPAVITALHAGMILVARVSGAERLSPFESAAEVEFSIEAATSPEIDITGVPVGTLKVTRFCCCLPAGTGRGNLGQTTVIAVCSAIAGQFPTIHRAISFIAPVLWPE